MGITSTSRHTLKIAIKRIQLQVWERTPLIPGTWEVTQEDYKFETSLGNLARP